MNSQLREQIEVFSKKLGNFCGEEGHDSPSEKGSTSFLQRALKKFKKTKFFDFLASPTFAFAAAIVGAASCILFPPGGILALGITACTVYVAFAGFAAASPVLRSRYNKELKRRDSLLEDTLGNLENLKSSPEFTKIVRDKVSEILKKKSGRREVGSNFLLKPFLEVQRNTEPSYVAAFVFSTVGVVMHLNPFTMASSAFYLATSLAFTDSKANKEHKYRNEKRNFLNIHDHRIQELSNALEIDCKKLRKLKEEDFVKVMDIIEQGNIKAAKFSSTKEVNERESILNDFQLYKSHCRAEKSSFRSDLFESLKVGISASAAEDYLLSTLPENKIVADHREKKEDILSSMQHITSELQKISIGNNQSNCEIDLSQTKISLHDELQKYKEFLDAENQYYEKIGKRKREVESKSKKPVQFVRDVESFIKAIDSEINKVDNLEKKGPHIKQLETQRETRRQQRRHA